jgi:hypothetical protein
MSWFRTSTQGVRRSRGCMYCDACGMAGCLLGLGASFFAGLLEIPILNFTLAGHTGWDVALRRRTAVLVSLSTGFVVE